MDTDNTQQNNQKSQQTAQNSIVSTELKSTSSEKLPGSSKIELNEQKLGEGFITHIRMDPVPPNQSYAYARFQPDTGAVCPITPEGKTQLKKAVFPKPILLSPNSGNPSALGDIVATTPQGKTTLFSDLLVGDLYTPTKNTQYQIIRMSNQGKKQKKLFIEDSVRLAEFKTLFEAQKPSLEPKTDAKKKKEIKLPLPEFRGGITVLTAEDVKYRSSKNTKTGGHRSLFKKPRQVMDNQSAKEAAEELGLVTRECSRWDWGHLLPAGGTAKGIEVNENPYNFLAVPATLNTWQMVPEMVTRHLALLGFAIEYTVSARAEKTDSGEFSFVAKEIYTSIKLQNHGLIAEFFTTREGHQKPFITDAVHVLSDFYKVAGKPVPEDLKEKFEKELTAELKDLGKSEEIPELLGVPEKKSTKKESEHVECAKVLIFSDIMPKQSAKGLKNKKEALQPKPAAGLKNTEEKSGKKRSAADAVDNPKVDNPKKEEPVSKRTRSSKK